MTLLHLLRRFGLATALVVAGVLPVLAQDFDSGSDGSDLALTFEPDAGVVVFDPKTMDPPRDPDGDNVFHFTTITVPAGTTVRLGADTLGEGKPVVWLASGDVRIEGTLDLSGDRGHDIDQPPLPSIAGAGGYSGGVGSTTAAAPTAGNGPGGGQANDNKGGHAGHLLRGTQFAGNAPPGPAYGNRFLLPLRGGSGGGGAGLRLTLVGSGGGAGGGAILIASSSSVQVLGTIIASGGAAGTKCPGCLNREGGAGSGGAVRLMAPVVNVEGTIDVRGGTSASPGRVRIEALVRGLSGQVSPAESITTASPGVVFLSAAAPSVRITRVGTAAAPADPTGSFGAPDVTLDANTSVTVEIAASNIPVGTQLSITLNSEDASPVTVLSTLLAGTLEASTAMAEVTLPHGFTRLIVTASWTP